jgi:hypothetical protein
MQLSLRNATRTFARRVGSPRALSGQGQSEIRRVTVHDGVTTFRLQNRILLAEAYFAALSAKPF